MPQEMTLEEMLREVQECMGKGFRDDLERKIDDQKDEYGADRYDDGYSNGRSDSYCDRAHSD